MSPFIVSGRGSFIPAPEGVHVAVCCEVKDLGFVESRNPQYEGREEVKIVWQINVLDERSGKPFEVHARYGKTIGPRSKLGKLLIGWRGRPFTDEERNAFDLEAILGKCCQLQVIHNTTEQGTFANVEAALPLVRGMAKITPVDYMPLDQRQAQVQSGPRETEVADDDVPF